MTIICPKCMTEEADIRLHLLDGDTFECHECEEEFTLDQIESVIECWSKLLPWLKANPVREPQCEAVTK